MFATAAGEGEAQTVTLWMSFGLRSSPEREAGTGTIVLISEHNLDAGQGTARPSFQERGWRAIRSRTFPEQKEKEESWAWHNDSRAQTGSQIKHRASPRNISPRLGKR